MCATYPFYLILLDITKFLVLTIGNTLPIMEETNRTTSL